MSYLYKLSEVVELIAKEYKFELNDGTIEKLKKKIKSICEDIKIETKGNDGQLIKTPLWQVSKRGQNSRGDHFFTYEELQMILASEALYDYIQNNVRPIEYAERLKKDKELAEQWTTAARADSCTKPFEIPSNLSATVHSSVKEEDLEKKKFKIMIEALFLRYFTPVDMDLLRSDMELVDCDSGTDEYTPKFVAAYNRLKNNCGYYEELKQEDGTDPQKN